MTRVVLCPRGGRIDEAAFEARLATLPPDEQARIRRKRHWEDRQDSLLGYGLARALVARALGIDERRVRLERDDRERPRLVEPAGASLDVNFSHSRGHVAAAVCDRGRVGVDVEVMRDVQPGTAERCFTEGELAWMRDGPPHHVRVRFFRLWTLKEAYLKATGQGIAARLKSIDFFQLEGDARVRVEGDPGASDRWHFRSWRLPDAWLSVCSEDPELPERYERAPG